jgi:hypothetical protein
MSLKTVQHRDEVPNYSQTLLFNVYCLGTQLLITPVLQSSLLDFNLGIRAFLLRLNTQVAGPHAWTYQYNGAMHS